MDFYKYLDLDFSSQHFLFTFLLENWLLNGQKVWEIQIFVSKMQKQVIKVCTKIEKSQKVLTNLENLD
jgi:hypothetical protein